MLKTLRTRAGLSQEALACHAGVHPSYVSQIESGARIPSVPVLERILVAVGATDVERSRVLRVVSSSRSAA